MGQSIYSFRLYGDFLKTLMPFHYSLWLNLGGAFFSVLAMGWMLAMIISQQVFWNIPLMILMLVLAVIFLFKAVGFFLKYLHSKPLLDKPLGLAFKALKGEMVLDKGYKGPPAPELVLKLFAQQVRSYAMEKSYHSIRIERDKNAIDPLPILKRRWSDVQDTLGELELYLAQDPKAVIEKLVQASPKRMLDVSQIFQDVSDTFDTSWRRRGINIESAIVKPLKATTHELLLRRLLAGPWRAAVYLTPRGQSVTFSAKSEQGRVLAQWLCQDLTISESWLSKIQNSLLPINQRIEEGLEVLGGGDTLHGLVSLITWIDIANASKLIYSMKNKSQGFVFEIQLPNSNIGSTVYSLS